MLLGKATMPGRIKYIKGDATMPESGGLRFVLQVNNDEGKYGAGFSGAVSRRWPQVEKEYRNFYRMSANPTTLRMPLGKIQTVPVQSDITVINMIAQRGIANNKESSPIRYDALEDCIKQVGELAQRDGASIHAPRIGCGLAGGTWEEIEPMIIKHFVARGANVIIYDLN